MKTKQNDGTCGEKEKTGLDVAEAVKEMIKGQYPQIDEEGAMRLAMLLTKSQLKKERK